jgi:hypothetical protein
VAGVAVLGQRVVQAAHALGGADVDRVLVLEGAALVAGDEAEQADVPRQFLQRELLLRALVQVVQAKAGEVRDQHVARQVAVLEAGEVVAGLAVGADQVLAARLVLDQEDALPQQVDEPAGAVLAPDRHFEAGDPAPVHAEHVEERVPEGLGLGAFGRLALPLLGERDRPRLDLIPAQRHPGPPLWLEDTTVSRSW